MAGNRKPDLVILCSRQLNTVTARVYGGVLIWAGGTRHADLRVRAAMQPEGGVREVECRCGRHVGWAAVVLLNQRGKVNTADVERLSDERMRSLFGNGWLWDRR